MSVKVLGGQGLVLLFLLLGWSACDGAELPPHVQFLSENVAPRAPKEIILETFRWATISETESMYYLTVCTDTNLTTNADTSGYKYTLVYGSEVAEEKDVSGELDDDPYCAIFTVEDDPGGILTDYGLEVLLQNNTIVGLGRAELYMEIPPDVGSLEVMSIIVNAPVNMLYRAVIGPELLPGCYASDNSIICYSDTVKTFDSCYSVNTTGGDSVDVCSEGEIIVTEANLTNETLTIASLDYGTSELSVSLETTTHVSIEAIVTNGDGDPFVYVSSDPETVTLAGFAPSSTVYGVTLVGLDNSAVPTVVGESSITDLNVLVYYDEPMIEFGFDNRNTATELYHAALEETPGEDPVHQTTIDCSALDETDICFGFLGHEPPALVPAAEVTVLVQYDNADGLNLIIAPLTISKQK